MRNQDSLKILLTLLLATAFIFSFSHFGAKAYTSYFIAGELYGEGTAVGSLDVAGRTRAEAAALIEEKSEEWKKAVKLTLAYKEKKTAVSTKDFTFLKEKTVSDLSSGRKTLASVELPDDSVKDMLLKVSSSIASDDVEIDKLKKDLMISATMLEAGSYVLNLESYIPGSDREEVINTASVSGGQNANELERLAKAGPVIEIPAGAPFSLQKNLLEKLDLKLTAGAESRLATAVYQVIGRTNFEMIERHISRELPDYAELGVEAKADSRNKLDLIFYNPNKYGFKLAFAIEGDRLAVKLSGRPFLYSYEIAKRDQKSFDPKAVLHFKPQLSFPQTVIEKDGKEGQLVRMYRNTVDEKGRQVKSVLLSEDFYAPVYSIHDIGLIKPLPEIILSDETLPFEEEEEEPAAEDDSGSAVEDNTEDPAAEEDSENTPDPGTEETEYPDDTDEIEVDPDPLQEDLPAGDTR
ncbi:hypothetical protein V1498_05710 [Peribacillus sp. SCS-26]|uniref:hypothetical protein n=1 Tax=Paraperibacillus marinus TaxID=3115295 RepID=UPI0039059946